MGNGTHAAVDGDHETHDEVAEHAGTDGISPVKTDSNHRRG